MVGTMLLEHEPLRDTYSLLISGNVLDEVMDQFKAGAEVLSTEDRELSVEFAVVQHDENGCVFVPIDEYRGR